MKLLAAVLREIKDLFVEDNRFAAAIIGLAAVVIGVAGMGAPPALIGILLVGGSLGLLTDTVLRARAKAKPPDEQPAA
jgi:hypothetical protein